MRRVTLLVSFVLLTVSLFAQNLDSMKIEQGQRVNGVGHWNVTVTLDSPAPADGAEVTFAADPTNSALIPASVTIPAGKTMATVIAGVNPFSTEGTIWANLNKTLSEPLPAPVSVSYEEILDKMERNEQSFNDVIRNVHPLVETYIQNLHQDKDGDIVPASDQYFLSRMNFSEKGYAEVTAFNDPGTRHSLIPIPHVPTFIASILSRKFLPQGFMQMTVLDPNFKRDNYDFKFVRQEFLGELRCYVFDMTPREGHPGLFEGRIWIEDKDDNIVRFNGTYSSAGHGLYLHFDSWRSNVQPGVWLPTYVYSQEMGDNTRSTLPPYNRSYYFKAQTRIWGYDSDPSKHGTEMTSIRLESNVTDHTSNQDYGPLEEERKWERSAEDNAIDHLQALGLIAPTGEMDGVLQTIVNNIVLTNNLTIPEVRCRVLLTTPIESFTIGNTIVVSKGLLDVLPDEASLAAVIAHELAHIVLGHRINTEFAFNDRFFFADENTFQRMNFTRSPQDEAAADKKGIELLLNSPYKDKLGTAGLFLESLQAHSMELPNLIHPHLGNSMEVKKIVEKMSPLMTNAPRLEERSLTQTAALPLGSHVKVNAWDGSLTLLHSAALPLLSAQDKMPFEVTPISLYLTRIQVAQ